MVTGASDGIGEAIARELAARGLRLVLVARREERLRALDAELGGHGRVVVADLATREGVLAVIEAAADLDVGLLVASAGFGTSGAFVEGDLQAEFSMLDVNCRAVCALAHHFGKRLVARKRGGMVLMSSLLAFQGTPGAAHYAATKAYVQTFAEGLARELAPHGVAVLASAPGPVHTGFAERADMKMSMGITPEQVARGTVRALGRRTTVRPGWLSKFLEGSMAFLPRALRARILGRVMGSMIAHQRA